VIAIADYLTGPTRDDKLSALIKERLCKPVNHGGWTELLRETLRHLRSRDLASFVPELTGGYFAAGPGNLKDLGDRLVELRNELQKQHPDTLPAPARQKEFKRGLMDFLRSVAFLKDYPVISAHKSTTEAGIKSHHCRWHAGFHDHFTDVQVQCDLDLELDRPFLLDPSRHCILDLHPFYAVERCDPGCNEVHFFRFERVDKARIQYIAAAGHRWKHPTAGAELLQTLQAPRPVSGRKTSTYFAVQGSSIDRRLGAGHKVSGKYEVLRHLRSGGTSDIYEVREIPTDSHLAMKLLPARFLADPVMVLRFQQEAQQAWLLNHPFVTRVFDHGEDLPDHYLIMELATGWTLPGGGSVLDVGELPKPVEEKVALQILKHAADALDYIHQRGIIHRDIKPGNLLLFPQNIVKLADFGISTFRESVTLTLTGLIMGTPEYMSPEQTEGSRDLTSASDIYSLGVVVYELLTGKSPFRRNTPVATALAHLAERPKPARTLNEAISEPLSTVVMRCLERAPEQRFPTARALYQAVIALE
jgi:hypothetical protein